MVMLVYAKCVIAICTCPQDDICLRIIIFPTQGYCEMEITDYKIPWNSGVESLMAEILFATLYIHPVLTWHIVLFPVKEKAEESPEEWALER